MEDIILTNLVKIAEQVTKNLLKSAILEAYLRNLAYMESFQYNKYFK